MSNHDAPEYHRHRRQLTDWLARNQFPVSELQALAGDASLRRYYRAYTREGRRIILMDARTEQQSLSPFLAAAQELSNGGLRIPRILAQDQAEGLLVLEDLGQTTFLDLALAGRRGSGARSAHKKTTEIIANLYQGAIDEIALIHALPCAHLRHYDASLLEGEMNLFRDWFLQKELGFNCESDRDFHTNWSAVVRLLVANALAQPQVWVHRDYHSRNLMYTSENGNGAGGRPVLLDFQDAVRGPANYDLLSLLRDYYCELSTAEVSDLQNYFLSITKAYAHTSADEFIRCFDWVGAQRHLKVIGIFTRLKHRDGKAGYLSDIPRAYRYLCSVSTRYPELDWLNRLLHSDRVSQWITQAALSPTELDRPEAP